MEEISLEDKASVYQTDLELRVENFHRSFQVVSEERIDPHPLLKSLRVSVYPDFFLTDCTAFRVDVEVNEREEIKIHSLTCSMSIVDTDGKCRYSKSSDLDRMVTFRGCDVLLLPEIEAIVDGHREFKERCYTLGLPFYYLDTQFMNKLELYALMSADNFLNFMKENATDDKGNESRILKSFKKYLTKCEDLQLPVDAFVGKIVECLERSAILDFCKTRRHGKLTRYLERSVIFNNVEGILDGDALTMRCTIDCFWADLTTINSFERIQYTLDPNQRLLDPEIHVVDTTIEIKRKKFCSAKKHISMHQFVYDERGIKCRISATVFPKGVNEDTEGWLVVLPSVLLLDVSQPPLFSELSWTVSIIDIEGNSVLPQFFHRLPSDGNFSVTKYLERSVILKKSDEYLPKGVLTVRCDIHFTWNETSNPMPSFPYGEIFKMT